MTDDEINQRIAEACGWKWHGAEEWEPHPRKPYWKQDGGVPYQTAPNYVSDLNAMHEAEKTLDARATEAFMKALYRQIEGCYLQTYCDEIEWDESFPLVTATARQRAEAFLKTIQP